MNRVQLIKRLIERRGCRSYLEIGCDRNRTFDAVAAPHKVGVDCRRGGTLRITSDEFFRINRERFDLVFVDGLHLHEQVIRDVENSLACLNPDGCVVIHDCLPKRREHQERRPGLAGSEWTGDVWKAIIHFRERPDCDVAVLDADWGLGVLLARPNTDPISSLPPQLTWEGFVAHRNKWLRVVDLEGLWAFLQDGP